MTEEETRLEAEKKTAEESAKKEAEERATELKTKSVEELAELLTSTKSEARTRRLKERELEEEIAKMKAEQKKIDEDKLIADGKLKELLDSKIVELTDTQTKLTSAETRAEESANFKAAKVEEYKTLMGSKWDDSYAKLPLISLDKLVLLSTPKKIGSDNGVDGEHADIELDSDQKRSAKAMYPHINEVKAFEHYKHNLIQTGKIKKKD